MINIRSFHSIKSINKGPMRNSFWRPFSRLFSATFCCCCSVIVFVLLLLLLLLCYTKKKEKDYSDWYYESFRVMRMVDFIVSILQFNCIGTDQFEIFKIVKRHHIYHYFESELCKKNCNSSRSVSTSKADNKTCDMVLVIVEVYCWYTELAGTISWVTTSWALI
jgi:hypothetical protein